MADTQVQEKKEVKTEQQLMEEQALTELAKLGGQAFREEDILFQGDKLVLPSSMNLTSAIEFLERKKVEDEETTQFHRAFLYRPWDGAYATWHAFKEAFGSVAHNKRTVEGFFGSFTAPPQIINIKIGPTEEVQVPWGEFTIPLLPNTTINLDAEHTDEWGLIFAVNVTAPKKYRHHVEGLFKLIDLKLKESSIYKGRAIDGGATPNFLDLRGFDPSKVIYSEETQVQLEANIWSLLRYADQQRKLGMPLKRATLIEGPYGTGKTLAALMTAQIAEENGWTFLYARPGVDHLETVMSTARLYQPAVVFFEDLDTVAGPGRRDGITTMLDAFDGITAKNTEIMVILTTNHKERIHKGMVRPGRLDSVIHIGALDEEGVKRMVQATIPPHMLANDVDYPKVGQAMADFMPAFVKEACDRTLRYAISRSRGETENITIRTDDFVHAAQGLQPQLELMQSNSDTITKDVLGSAMGGVVRGEVGRQLRSILKPELQRRPSRMAPMEEVDA